MKTWCALAFLWFAYFCHGTLSCPALCRCYKNSLVSGVYCYDIPMIEYPSETLPNDTDTLTIRSTHITSVSEKHLNATPLLKAALLQYGQLQNLSSPLLRGVPNLGALDLRNNKIANMPAGVFSLTSLKWLILENNLFEEANPEWFPDNSSLVQLDLSGNRLTQIPAALLQKLPHLEELDLSENRLEKISANSLDLLTQLEKLELGSNQLDTLPQNLFQKLTKLNRLYLADNPWVCDGRAEYLWRWLQENKEKVFMPDTIICASPPSLAGRPIISLTESELNL